MNLGILFLYHKYIQMFVIVRTIIAIIRNTFNDSLTSIFNKTITHNADNRIKNRLITNNDILIC